MLSVLSAHAAMLLTFQIVLIVLGLTVVVNIVSNLWKGASLSGVGDIVTRPVLTGVFPLIIISLLTQVDPTHIIVLIFYYLAAVCIVIRALFELARSLRKTA
ncbi:hypothetical protein AAC03nite_08030 [Alicyclobacillus acidoterrestris]|uniref:hypothetical protein n=1 Tax=Alicyclobacillus suci TaxID=2816080 RepID=UPI001195740F|nr:hypothetical protein [Alicyclobacillus suci]GEO25018.1 hypothetical protein AAC03nite_08030 [Alicyclobacillus acidoterrestris]